MNIFFVNKCQDLIQDKDFQSMVKAAAFSLINHVAPAWDRRAPVVEPLTAGKPVPAPRESLPIYLFATPDVADAAGYHDETPDGLIYGKVFVRPTLDSGGSLFTGANSVLETMSHEGDEGFVDPACQMWADGPRGRRSCAYEVGDPVQGQCYQVTIDGQQLDVSNFVHPQWFDRNAKGPYDHLKSCTKPFQITKGGYAIIRTGGPGTEKDVFGRFLGEHKHQAHKQHPASRTARRRG